MKLKKMTVSKVGYSELDYFIRWIYCLGTKREFSIVAMEEWRNDSYHLFSLKKKPLNECEERDLTEWKTDPFGCHYKLRVILQDLVNNGHLEEGNLLIEVCW